MGVASLNKNLLAHQKDTSVWLQDTKNTQQLGPARRTVTFLQLLQKTPSNLRQQIAIRNHNILQS